MFQTVDGKPFSLFTYVLFMMKLFDLLKVDMCAINKLCNSNWWEISFRESVNFCNMFYLIKSFNFVNFENYIV